MQVQNNNPWGIDDNPLYNDPQLACASVVDKDTEEKTRVDSNIIKHTVVCESPDCYYTNLYIGPQPRREGKARQAFLAIQRGWRF